MPPRCQVRVSSDVSPVKLEGRMVELPRISGPVVDGDGNGIAKARLEVIGRTDRPVTSNTAGNFELQLNPGAYILSVVHRAALLHGHGSFRRRRPDYRGNGPFIRPTPITIVYKTDGGSVRGAAEKYAGGLVLLIPQDPALQSLGFFRSARCDPGDQYEFTAVRPGDYHALAFAGPGGAPQLDDILISDAAKVAVHVDETTSADLRAIQRPGYRVLALLIRFMPPALPLALGFPFAYHDTDARHRTHGFPGGSRSRSVGQPAYAWNPAHG